MDLSPLEEALQSHKQVTVTGASGSGLSTLANQIHDTWPNAAVVGQDPIAHVTYLRTTVVEEAAIGLEQRGVPRLEMQRRVDAILDAAGLTDLAEHDPTTLSGGQTRRLAIACVAVLEPETLVLDDPFAGLDPESAARIQKLLDALPSRTVVLSTKGEGHFSLVRGELGPPVAAEPVRLPPPVAPSEMPMIDLGEVVATRGEQKRKWWQPRKSTEPIFTAGPIHLALKPGEVLWLRGDNGAGKTTLLRALAGLDGNPGLEDTHGVSVSLALQRAADQVSEVTTAGFVGDEAALKRLTELGVKLDPDEHPLDLPAAHLRLAQLAQVFSQGRQLVLLDEPDVGLDSSGRGVARALIADGLSTGKAVVMTCHDASFAGEVGAFARVDASWLLR
ncbi:ABC transporter ATP-binding protein [Corynebacterium sp. Q4381]|uniref:ATP-binding cassette domain-containing protein n=1 Tax=Corynebacterium sp. Marseille-Q4381 TaxID=3121597 RepID=UPI002FE53BC0